MTKEQILWNIITKEKNYTKEFKDYDDFLDEVQNIHGKRITTAMEEYAQQQLSAERERAGKLIGALNEYIVLLGEELDEVMGFVNAHQWKSTRFEKGEELRQKIKQAAYAYQEVANHSS